MIRLNSFACYAFLVVLRYVGPFLSFIAVSQLVSVVLVSSYLRHLKTKAYCAQEKIPSMKDKVRLY